MMTTDAQALSYAHHPSVRCLRAMPFIPYPDVLTALMDPEFAPPAPDEGAMMVFDGAAMFELNLVSSFVWDLLDGTRTVDDVVQAIMGRFSVDHDTAEHDVDALCAAFAAQHLVIPASVHI